MFCSAEKRSVETPGSERSPSGNMSNCEHANDSSTMLRTSFCADSVKRGWTSPHLVSLSTSPGCNPSDSPSSIALRWVPLDGRGAILKCCTSSSATIIAPHTTS
eukprot:3545806-Rhodomonas_salina.1